MWRLWPRKRMLDVVLNDDAGCDAAATLTMILRFHGRSASRAEVRAAIDAEGCSPGTALGIVQAAERFRLRARGLQLTQPRHFFEIAKPSIVHILPQPGPFPRDGEGGGWAEGYFAVLEAASLAHIGLIDPYVGRVDVGHAAFFTIASGVVLTFGEGAPLPRAALRGRT